jgi:endonuclease/exonuclease/phosphatase family metal-dependent hydrolase
MKYLFCLLFLLNCISAAELNIMSFNIWHDGKAGKQPLSQTVKVIKDSGADIVGLQEVKKNAQAIAEKLNWHHIHHRRDTAIISRYKINSVTTHKNGALIEVNGKTIALFNVHFYHAPYQPYQLLNIPYGKAPFIKTEKEAIEYENTARAHEVKALLKDISLLKDQSIPIFITGDFNEPSHLDWTDKTNYHPIKVAWPTTLSLEKAGFKDSYRIIHTDPVKKPGFTWTPISSKESKKDHHDRIDFVLYKNAKVIKSEVVGEAKDSSDIVIKPFPSDHRAVLSRFIIN